MDTSESQKYLQKTADRMLKSNSMKNIPPYKRWWGGAGVIVSDRETSRPLDRYGPNHRTFVSPYPSEMTWVFNRAKYATKYLPEVWSWKFEYYGSLSNAGNAFVKAKPDASAEQLALAVLLEALLFMRKLDSPEGVPVLPVVLDGEINDDFKDRRTSWLEVKKTWTMMGVKIP
jgi:hypothetical protein